MPGHADAGALADVLEGAVAAVAIEDIELRLVGERPGIGRLLPGGSFIAGSKRR